MRDQSAAQYQSATLLVPLKSSSQGQIVAKLGAPLGDRQITESVCLRDPRETTDMGLFNVMARQTRESLVGQYKVVIATWPDQAAAILMFDPSQTRPRATQLIRAYYGARAGLLLTMKSNNGQEGTLPC